MSSTHHTECWIRLGFIYKEHRFADEERNEAANVFLAPLSCKQKWEMMQHHTTVLRASLE